MLQGEEPENWREAVYYHYYAQFHVPEHYGIRTDRYKLIRYPERDRWTLFDLRHDPREMNNLYGKDGQADTVQRLKDRLRELRKRFEEPNSARLP